VKFGRGAPFRRNHPNVFISPDPHGPVPLDPGRFSDHNQDVDEAGVGEAAGHPMMEFQHAVSSVRARASEMFFRARFPVGLFVFGIAVAIPAESLRAQQIAVQQPIVDVFAGSTTVSVPDRGQAFLGGVGRSASSSSVYGPFRANRNFGRSTTGTGVSVRVWIHDFEELDRQALEAAGPPGPRAAGSHPASRADRAYEALRNRNHIEPAADVPISSGRRHLSKPRADRPVSSAADARRSRRSRR
jgi:hypothetical protein